MTASYQLIDYSVRPAKFAERKMLSEMLGRLKVFGSLETYRYIGFGSIWFSDCVLFHRALGIEHMVSIGIFVERRFSFGKMLLAETKRNSYCEIPRPSITHSLPSGCVSRISFGSLVRYR